MAHDTGCNQGRVGLASTNATRACIGLAPLHQEDGGHSVHAGIAFPIEADDQAPETPESAGATFYNVASFLAIVAAVILLAMVPFLLHDAIH